MKPAVLMTAILEGDSAEAVLQARILVAAGASAEAEALRTTLAAAAVVAGGGLVA